MARLAAERMFSYDWGLGRLVAPILGWSEQQRIEQAAPEYLRNVVRIITETGLHI
jgi:hypothetical protein